MLVRHDAAQWASGPLNASGPLHRGAFSQHHRPISKITITAKKAPSDYSECGWLAAVCVCVCVLGVR